MSIKRCDSSEWNNCKTYASFGIFAVGMFSIFPSWVMLNHGIQRQDEDLTIAGSVCVALSGTLLVTGAVCMCIFIRSVKLRSSEEPFCLVSSGGGIFGFEYRL